MVQTKKSDFPAIPSGVFPLSAFWLFRISWAALRSPAQSDSLLVGQIWKPPLNTKRQRSQGTGWLGATGCLLFGVSRLEISPCRSPKATSEPHPRRHRREGGGLLQRGRLQRRRPLQPHSTAPGRRSRPTPYGPLGHRAK